MMNIYPMLGQCAHENSRPDVLSKMLFNLATISAIPRGKKINTSKEYVTIDSGGMFQCVYRTLAAESRDRAVRDLCREVRGAILVCTLMLESSWLATLGERVGQHRAQRLLELKRLIWALSAASVGINNLCDTYCTDANVVGNLRQLVYEINVAFSMVSARLQEIGETVH
jgi:hypothetical protein